MCLLHCLYLQIKNTKHTSSPTCHQRNLSIPQVHRHRVLGSLQLSREVGECEHILYESHRQESCHCFPSWGKIPLGFGWMGNPQCHHQTADSDSWVLKTNNIPWAAWGEFPLQPPSEPCLLAGAVSANGQASSWNNRLSPKDEALELSMGVLLWLVKPTAVYWPLCCPVQKPVSSGGWWTLEMWLGWTEIAASVQYTPDFEDLVSYGWNGVLPPPNSHVEVLTANGIAFGVRK